MRAIDWIAEVVRSRLVVPDRNDGAWNASFVKNSRAYEDSSRENTRTRRRRQSRAGSDRAVRRILPDRRTSRRGTPSARSTARSTPPSLRFEVREVVRTVLGLEAEVAGEHVADTEQGVPRDAGSHELTADGRPGANAVARQHEVEAIASTVGAAARSYRTTTRLVSALKIGPPAPRFAGHGGAP